jgi:glutamyl-Q tRNA(Asp) synthetase
VSAPIVSRFAPSTTGFAHPGTLLSALLVWLDARALGGRALLRLEDVDHTRCKPEWAEQMRVAMMWMGLDWDHVAVQSARTDRHEAALDRLAAAGRLYPCSCTRSERRGGRRAPDGGWAYENTCRARPLPPGGWRAVTEVLRARLDDDAVELVDEGGLVLSQTPAHDLGDPVVRRRDGVLAYQLVVVVDDGDQGVNRVVRGHDIATSTATQVLLQRLLGVPQPAYRHHLLLVEPAAGAERAERADQQQTARLKALAPARPGATSTRDEAAAPRPAATPPEDGLIKLAKLHGSIPFSEVRTRYSGAQLCGRLAHAIGLLDEPRAVTPAELVTSFTWQRVRSRDLVATWSQEHGLEFAEPGFLRPP